MIGRVFYWRAGARIRAIAKQGADAEELQAKTLSSLVDRAKGTRFGKEHGFEPLRSWFTAIYEVFLGASQGPRFGGFIALYGTQETAELIDAALADARAAV